MSQRLVDAFDQRQMFADRYQSPKPVKKNDFINKIRIELERAVALWNIHDETAFLHFTDGIGNNKIEEVRVMAVTERYAVLMGGRSIPIENVTKVVT